MMSTSGETGSPIGYERQHSNGVCARVTCTTFLNLLNYQVTRFRLDTFGHPTEVRVETGYPTVAEAQQRADAIAHEGCTGKGCGSWHEVKP